MDSKNFRKISGTVVKGDQYGRKLGFPTVNLDVQTKDLPAGVYSGTGALGAEIYKAAIVINDIGRTEAHLIDYNEDAYGKEVTLEIQKFIREYKKFETEAELIEQIKKDIQICSQE